MTKTNKVKKYKVISLHPYLKGCNLNCPFCYVNKIKTKNTKPRKFWYDLVPYLKQLTNQIALGSSGEPFMDIPFVKKFSVLCNKNGLICNVTSNGRLLMNLDDGKLKETLKNITMISLSFDDYKIQTKEDLDNYIKLVKRIKKLTKTQVGSNLLVNKKMFEKNGLVFKELVENLFKNGCDRVFALSPKNIPCPDILKFKVVYLYLTMKYEHFYVDDLSRMILEEEKYRDWCKSCHYFKNTISINEKGHIMGCSFDNENKSLLKLEKPKDILKIMNIKAQERFNCPYLNIK